MPLLGALAGSTVRSSGLFKWPNLPTWPSIISGDVFYRYTPTNIFGVLGSGSTGSVSRLLQTSYLSMLINGQGRGVLGNGAGGGVTNTNYQIVYDPTGTASFNYSGYNDAFQPGTPHELGFFEIGGASGFFIGGQNNASTITGLVADNGTVYSWTPPDGSVIVMLGSGGSNGTAIFQYRATDRVLRMHMSYFNTTASTKSVRMIRGGDPDLDGYSTNNSILGTTKVSGTGTTTGKTIGIYCPGNGFTTNTGIISGWGTNNPMDTVLSGTNAGNGDNAIYAAVNVGNVNAGQSVGLNVYYTFGVGETDAFSRLGV